MSGSTQRQSGSRKSNATTQGREVKSKLNTCGDMLYHYRGEEAVQALQEATALMDAFRAGPYDAHNRGLRGIWCYSTSRSAAELEVQWQGTTSSSESRATLCVKSSQKMTTMNDMMYHCRYDEGHCSTQRSRGVVGAIATEAERMAGAGGRCRMQNS